VGINLCAIILGRTSIQDNEAGKINRGYCIIIAIDL
jgi:hypothetical protein